LIVVFLLSAPQVQCDQAIIDRDALQKIVVVVEWWNRAD
jgi:hypothetical protein